MLSGFIFVSSNTFNSGRLTSNFVLAIGKLLSFIPLLILACTNTPFSSPISYGRNLLTSPNNSTSAVPFHFTSLFNSFLMAFSFPFSSI